MIELENAQIESVEELETETYGKYEASPLRAGYGVTLGNALRRVLLSSLEGAAVTSVQIRDVSHEFSTIAGVKEDVIQILLNLKRLRLKSYVPHPTQLKLVKSGAGPVTAADIVESADVEIVNPDQHILTLEPDATIEMDLTVERGTGYLSAEDTKEGLPIGVIPVDAIFTPVRKVDYHVENTRVGQVTNYDKLTLEIETDGTISPEEALSRAAEMLVEQFGQFTTAGRQLTSEVEAVSGQETLPPNVLDMPIEDLDLPMRAYNSLKRNNIVKVGQLLQLQDEDLLRMRNFGKKSLDEMKDRLRMRGFLPPEDEALDGFEAEDLEDLDVADQPFAERTYQELRAMVALRDVKAARRPVLKTTATTGEGIEALIDAIEGRAGPRDPAYAVAALLQPPITRLRTSCVNCSSTNTVMKMTSRKPHRKWLMTISAWAVPKRNMPSRLNPAASRVSSRIS